MDRPERRLTTAGDALATLEALVDLPSPSEIERDAAIQRFEYTFEAVWKAAQAVLAGEGLASNSPKATVRHCRSLGLLGDGEAVQAMAALGDRNLTTRTYNRRLAAEIYGRLGPYARLFRTWLTRMQQRQQA
ncbi:MAG: nucleotidyltransferase [Alphaproteobacteria bacterium]|jgi:nucleotidyltransferase substrate binding protein (TIGR01987 family)|nr:nucleotidyltransferase [Alphaproteobacteria bacterium]